MAEGGNIGEEKKRKKEESRRGKRQADVAEDINGKTGKVGGKGWGAEEGWKLSQAWDVGKWGI